MEFSAQLEQDRIRFAFLLGKYYKFKERFDDMDFTFVKIIKFSNSGGMICDSFCKGDLCDDCIMMGRTVYNFNEIHNMTEIPKDEFYYEVKKLLDVMNLEIKK